MEEDLGKTLGKILGKILGKVVGQVLSQVPGRFQRGPKAVPHPVSFFSLLSSTSFDFRYVMTILEFQIN